MKTWLKDALPLTAAAIVLVIALVGVLLAHDAYDGHRLEARMAYWESDVQQALSQGSAPSEAQIFFLDRGVDLHCIGKPDRQEWCYVDEDEA